MERDEDQAGIERVLEHLAECEAFRQLAARYPFARVELTVQEGCYVSGSLRVTARPTRRRGRPRGPGEAAV